MKLTKQDTRLRRARRGRRIKELAALCLSVHRTPQHIYAQISPEGDKVLVAASTCRRTCARIETTGNIEAAGRGPPRGVPRSLIAGRLDRPVSCITGAKALAEAARERVSSSNQRSKRIWRE
jgi:large subunit ribosomal protein L18